MTPIKKLSARIDLLQTGAYVIVTYQQRLANGKMERRTIDGTFQGWIMQHRGQHTMLVHDQADPNNSVAISVSDSVDASSFGYRQSIESWQLTDVVESALPHPKATRRNQLDRLERHRPGEEAHDARDLAAASAYNR